MGEDDGEDNNNDGGANDAGCNLGDTNHHEPSSSSSSSSAAAGSSAVPGGSVVTGSLIPDYATGGINAEFLTPTAKLVLQKVNDIRAEQGVQALRTHKGLCKAAEMHAARMADQIAPFSHENAFDRINECGQFEGCGENLARLDNYPLHAIPAGAVKGWINSPGHYRNMVLPVFNICGIGIATYYPEEKQAVRMFTDEPAQSITFVSFLFAVESTVEGTGFLDRFNAVVTTGGLIGWAIGGPFAGGALGLMAGAVVNHKIGTTPKGVGYCVYETFKRDVLNANSVVCTICNVREAMMDDKQGAYCDLCFQETHPSYRPPSVVRASAEHEAGGRQGIMDRLKRVAGARGTERSSSADFNDEPWHLL